MQREFLELPRLAIALIIMGVVPILKICLRCYYSHWFKFWLFFSLDDGHEIFIFGRLQISWRSFYYFRGSLRKLHSSLFGKKLFDLLIENDLFYHGQGGLLVNRHHFV